MATWVYTHDEEGNPIDPNDLVPTRNDQGELVYSKHAASFNPGDRVVNTVDGVPGTVISHPPPPMEHMGDEVQVIRDNEDPQKTIFDEDSLEKISAAFQPGDFVWYNDQQCQIVSNIDDGGMPKVNLQIPGSTTYFQNVPITSIGKLAIDNEEYNEDDWVTLDDGRSARVVDIGSSTNDARGHRWWVEIENTGEQIEVDDDEIRHEAKVSAEESELSIGCWCMWHKPESDDTDLGEYDGQLVQVVSIVPDYSVDVIATDGITFTAAATELEVKHGTSKISGPIITQEYVGESDPEDEFDESYNLGDHISGAIVGPVGYIWIDGTVQSAVDSDGFVTVHWNDIPMGHIEFIRKDSSKTAAQTEHSKGEGQFSHFDRHDDNWHTVTCNGCQKSGHFKGYNEQRMPHPEDKKKTRHSFVCNNCGSYTHVITQKGEDVTEGSSSEHNEKEASLTDIQQTAMIFYR